MDSCPEAPFVFAVGGEKEIKVWDIRESATGSANPMLIHKYKELFILVLVLQSVLKFLKHFKNLLCITYMYSKTRSQRTRLLRIDAYNEVIFIPCDFISCCKLDRYNELCL